MKAPSMLREDLSKSLLQVALAGFFLAGGAGFDGASWIARAAAQQGGQQGPMPARPAAFLAQTSAGATQAPAMDIPALLSSGALKGRKMILAGWGGLQSETTLKNFVKPFEDATGVQVTMIAAGGGFAAKVAAQADAKNVQWDMIDGPGAEGDILATMNLLEPFPASLMSALAPLVRPDQLVEPWRLRYGQAPYLIACNPAVMKKCPSNPRELWDTENFPGPRGILLSTPFAILTISEEAAGVPRDKLFPIDVPLAIGNLRKLKPSVKVWAVNQSQGQQVLADGEVGVEIISNGRANDLKKELPDLKISWDGAAVNPDGWVVPKGAANADVAFAFILWAAQHPENQAAWTTTMHNLTPAKDLAKYLSPEVYATTALAHDPIDVPHEVVVNQRDEIKAAMEKLLSGE